MKIFTCFGTGAIVLLSSQALLMKTSITMVLQTTSRGVGSSQKIQNYIKIQNIKNLLKNLLIKPKNGTKMSKSSSTALQQQGGKCKV